ncbi:MAG: hypothetical protein A3D31_05565 [Candidatus Fluviicola riflensis]|nr:MAG: hypothetical protein CHH17_09450 [Candidatus Fluviicola riflensis]OGS79437.1 MAG: hypothetical protein A3D31_05565 [Candidatus Fluviicola riflensis]OGS86869.1 MAG: hypothetical protein A2724_05025 [Fluviicola sp. RIFCSPHIGHO2_01_FULL_43_53]OGS89659.1 MAG: hypothetical protein A3E30_01770 [Fluviicola sp. RIFCSPHIGHO2_12_FULL_43_24]
MKSSIEKKHYESVIKDLSLDEAQKNLVKIIWLDYFLLLNKSARQGVFSSNTSQIIIIFFSLLIPVIEGIDKSTTSLPFGLSIVSVISIMIALITALNRQMNFDARWKHFRKNAEMMRNEGDDFFALSGEYKKFENHGEGFRDFMTSVTLFKRHEVDHYLEKQKIDKNSTNKNGEINKVQ